MLKHFLVQLRHFSTPLVAVMGLPQVVFVLGGPGAGKGTQCQKIVDEFGYTHLSAGDLLRAERKRPDSKYGSLIEHHITTGSIVPVEITCSLIEQAMMETMAENSDKDKFLIDGFPRNNDNLTGWSKQMDNKHHLQFVLFFDCDDQVCVDRCLSRGVGGSGRSDDNIDTLRKRISTYHESTRPIIDHYNGLNLVKKIDASLNVDEIFSNVKKHFTQASK